MPACHFKECDVSEHQLPDLDVWIEFYQYIQTPLFKEGGALTALLEKAGAFDDITLDILAQMDLLKAAKQREDLEAQRHGHGR